MKQRKDLLVFEIKKTIGQKLEEFLFLVLVLNT